MRTLKMSPMVGNRFSRCLGTTMARPMSRVPSLTHANGKAKLTSSICEQLQLTAVLLTNVSPETSARSFTSLRRNSYHNLGLTRQWVQMDSSSSQQLETKRSHASLASVDLTIAQAKTAEKMAEILKRGEYGNPDMKVSDFKDVEFRMHPSLEALNKHVKDWLLKHDIQTCFESTEAFEKYYTENCHRMALGFYSDAPVGRAAWCCYVCHTFFFFDDVFVDYTPDGQKPECTIPTLLDMFLSMLWSFPQGFRSEVQKVLDHLDHVPELRRQTEELIDKTVSEAILLPGTEYPYKLSPLGSAFRETWMMAVRERSPEYMQQFGKMFLDAHFGIVYDGMHPDFDTFPTFEAFMDRRSISMAIRAWGSMTGHAYDAPIPDEVFYSPNVQQMLKETALAAGMFSDIYSVQRDLESSKLNAVIVLAAHCLNCSLVEATNEAEKQLHKYNENMVALKATIEAETSPVHLPAVQKLLKVCFSIFGSSNDFFKSTSRYRQN